MNMPTFMHASHKAARYEEGALRAKYLDSLLFVECLPIFQVECVDISFSEVY